MFFIDEFHYHPQIADELELVFGLPVTLEKGESAKVQRSLTTYYRRKKNQPAQELRFDYSREKDLLRNLIRGAHELGSSDIHLEPYEDKCRVVLATIVLCCI